MAEENGKMRRVCDQHSAVEKMADLNCGAMKVLEAEMKAKLNSRTMLGIVSVVTVIILAVFGVIYEQNRDIARKVEINSEKINGLVMEQRVMQEKVYTFIRNAPPPHKHDNSGALLK